MQKKIAIVGSGISAMGCAHYLKDEYDITVFEKEDYLGGHTHTHHLQEDGRAFTVDTGFIIFNLETYPNLVRLFDELGVEKQRSKMTFSVWNLASGLYYSSDGARGLFAKSGTLFSLRHWRLLLEVLRFYRRARRDRRTIASSTETVAEYCNRLGFSRYLKDNYLIPVVSAIWSTDEGSAEDFPMATLIPFFHNHGMLRLFPPVQWYSVAGGSDTYTKRIIERGNFVVRLNEGVKEVSERDNAVRVVTEKGEYAFDCVVLACHADTSLMLTPGLSEEKRRILEKFSYKRNRAVLHTDASVMPPNRRAWASWNHTLDVHEGVTRTSTVYWLNPLQQTRAKTDYFVSINPFQDIDPAHVIKDMDYAHPHFTPENFALQEKLRRINDDGSILFAGAYFGYGFHEDGLVAGLNAVRRLSVTANA